jgi:hypothetical protein
MHNSRGKSRQFGACTTGIAFLIISENEASEMQADYFLVLSWHFEEGIVRCEGEFLARGGPMIFPFPKIEIAFVPA